ncbi:MAG: hypothetical protein ACYDC8_01310 [Gammaproteobacteria bacterium]
MQPAHGRRALNGQRGKRSRGASLWENLLVVILVAVLVTIAFNHFILLRVQAERLAMDQVLAELRAATLQHTLHLKASGAAADPAATNPVRWLSQPPPNYLGELAGPDPAAIPAGQWYFDTRDQLLVYRVDNEAYFDSPLGGAARARFKLVMNTADTLPNDALGVTPEHGPEMMTVKPVESYTWRTEPRDVSALTVWGVFGASP